MGEARVVKPGLGQLRPLARAQRGAGDHHGLADDAGLAAPLLIVAARLVQGFAIGGEVGASTAMLMEYAEDHNRGFYGSWQFFSQGLSFLMGSLVSLALSASLSDADLESWGWRIPFLLSAVLAAAWFAFGAGGPGLLDLYVLGAVTFASLVIGAVPAVAAMRRSLADGLSVRL